MILCVLIEAAESAAALDTLLEVAPRVVLEPPLAWLDVRGLDVEVVYTGLRRRLRRDGTIARFGAAHRAIVAQVAAAGSAAGELTRVVAAGEREFLSARPLSDLGLADPLLGWLADVGIGRCGELAAVSREAVEVRFGAEAVRWWQWARGHDERRLFRPVPPELPSASVDFIDYVVTDPERLLFTTNALLGGLCEQMRERGAHARRLRLRLPLANGAAWERTLRTARPTADRAAWLRLARTLLERLTVPDSVTGVALEVESTEAAASVQGDLFDTGFATASAVEGAMARLLEDQGGVVTVPVVTEHVLAEQRGSFRSLNVREALSAAVPSASASASASVSASASASVVAASGLPVADGAARSAVPGAAVVPGAVVVPGAAVVPGAVAVSGAATLTDTGLTLQLLPEPRRVVVETVRRRDHEIPVRYQDGHWRALIHAAGPDRVSGGQWEETYAREYFRAVATDGTLVWLFRDARRDDWFLHGWWD